MCFCLIGRDYLDGRVFESDFLESLMEKAPKLSKSQKKIFDFLINNYDKSAFMTAARLGEAAGVSESTVVRFAVEIGFSGYPAFQQALKKIIQNKLTTVERVRVADDQIGAQEDVLSRVLNLDVDKIKTTLDRVSRKDFENAVRFIVDARKIYVIGTGSASVLASFVNFYFSFIFEDVRVIYTKSKSETFEKISNIKEGDVLIGISFPRYSSNTVQAFHYAHSNYAKTIAITDSVGSPLAAKADSVLLAQSDMVSFVDGLVAPLSLLNALVVAVGLCKKSEISKTFQKLENIWKKYEVFEKSKTKKEN